MLRVICAILNLTGKVKHTKGRFTSRAMICANVTLQDLMTDVGIMSSGDDIDVIALSCLSTSSSVTSTNFNIELQLNG